MAGKTSPVDIAKAKYAEKVCGYLGIKDTGKCEAVFDKLYENMKRTFEAF